MDQVFGTYSSASLIQDANPYWGNVTATIDWCEENYVVTRYLAEWWNAVSNIVFLLYPLLGVWSVYKTDSEKRFTYAYLSMTIVGSGSFLFHGTLRYEAQMLDELPMVLMTCLMVFSCIQIKRSYRHLGIFLALLGALETAVYLFTDNVLFFQACFCGLTLVHVFASLYHANTLSIAIKRENENQRLKEEKKQIQPTVGKTFGKLLMVEIIAGALAGIVWLVDNQACDFLRVTREQVGAPLSTLLQFHAWWHLLTGLSGYTSIVLGQYMRSVALGRQDISIKWILGFLPVCTSKRRVKLRN